MNRDELRARIAESIKSDPTTVDLYCAVCGVYLTSVNPPAPPVPVHCTGCRALGGAPLPSTFDVTLRHDAGSITIRTTATTGEQAATQVCANERAPRRAVTSSAQVPSSRP